MEWLTTISAIILLVLLRIVLPIVVTITIIYVFKRLDERWKREADLVNSKLVQVGNIGCWDINECPAEQRAKCKAYNNPNEPCWQVFRERNGRLQERCIGCEIFRHSPIPLTA